MTPVELDLQAIIHYSNSILSTNRPALAMTVLSSHKTYRVYRPMHTVDFSIYFTGEKWLLNHPSWLEEAGGGFPARKIEHILNTYLTVLDAAWLTALIHDRFSEAIASLKALELTIHSEHKIAEKLRSLHEGPLVGQA